jgi:restriction endonuclease S subunit
VSFAKGILVRVNRDCYIVLRSRKRFSLPLSDEDDNKSYSESLKKKSRERISTGCAYGEELDSQRNIHKAGPRQRHLKT